MHGRKNIKESKKHQIFDSISLKSFSWVGCVNYEYSVILFSSIFNQGDVCCLWMYSVRLLSKSLHFVLFCGSKRASNRRNNSGCAWITVPFDESHVLLAICSHSASSTIVSHATLYTTSLSIPLNLQQLQYLQSVGRSHLAKLHSNKMKRAY